MKPWKNVLASMVLTIASGGSGIAHEFWIEGRFDPPDQRAELSLDLKVGLNLSGQSLPYIPENTVRFLRLDKKPGTLSAQFGSTPAAETAFVARDGFAAFIEMAPRLAKHADWDVFLQYLKMEGLNGIEEKHRSRGLPLSGFTESYARHAKVLVLAREPELKVPDHVADAPVEFLLDEITDTGNRNLLVRCRLLLSGKAAPGRQVAVFSRVGDKVRRTTLPTDTAGAFQITLPQDAEILLNAVVMTEGTLPGTVWHSDWASLFIK